MISATTQITYQTLTMAKTVKKSADFYLLRFLRYEDKIVPVHASALTICDRYAPAPFVPRDKAENDKEHYKTL